MNLNERQKEAVEHKEGPLLIIAGAGTGKTAVITQRILNIINNHWAKPNEILALTFTDKAADEMLTRVDENLPLSYGDIWISTFHSFCDRILRQEGHYIGLDTNYSMMSSAESYIFFRRHLFDFPLSKFRPQGNPTKFIDDILKHFSRLQDEDVSTSDYLEYAKNLPNITEDEKEQYQDINELAKTYEIYTQLKIKESKIDFGDLIILTIKLFRDKPNLLKKYRDKFKYILVDEFQDTNYTQSVLVNILSGLDPKDANKSIGKINPNLTVVGDDDQAIYKFRGAAISNILQFKHYYPNAKEVVLTENYRSRQEILDSSYSLITHNNPHRLEITEKVDKKLIARGVFPQDDDIVNLITAQNEDAEAEWIAKEILELTGHSENISTENVSKYDDRGQSAFVELIEDRKYKLSDIAILVRANSHADSIVQNLRYFGIPYKLGGSRGLYFRDEIKTLIAYLRILVDYTDEISMFKLLSMKEWGLSSRQFVEINRLAREEKISVFEEFEKLWNINIGEEEEVVIPESNIVNNILDIKGIQGINKLLNILNTSIKMVKDGDSIGSMLYMFVKDSGYLEDMLDLESVDAHFKVSNVSKFFDIVKDFEKNNPDTNIYEYVDYLNYSIEVGDSPLVDQVDLTEYDAVNILTVHSSKGLEFPVVFLVNLVSDRFPSQNRKDSIPIPDGLIKEALTGLDENEEHLSEERRLFYVGATRAKEKLYLTASNYYGNGKRKKKVSVFLHELLDRDITDEFNKPKVVKEDEGLNLDIVEDEKEVVPSEFKTKHAKRVSYSQINTYEDCPKKYEYSYVYRVPSRPSSALSFGTSIHNTLKDFYTLLKDYNEGLGITNPPTLEDMLNLYENNWISTGYQNKKHELDRKESGLKVIEKYYNKLYSQDQKPFRLEEAFTVHIGGSSFTGKIDRMDLVGMIDSVPVVDIVDYKTGKVKDARDIKTDLQLPLYALFAQESLGVKVRSARYIFVEHGVEIEVDISDNRKNKAREEIVKVIDSIKKEEFDATPGFVCKYCDYNSVCEDAIL